MRKNTRLSAPAQFQCSHSWVWDQAVMYDENETYSWTLPSEPQKTPPFLNPLPPIVWNHGCSNVLPSRHMISVISHLWVSYKCSLTLNTIIFSPSNPSHVWMALHYQANLVDDVTVGASLTLKNQHGTKWKLQTICVHVVCVHLWSRLWISSEQNYHLMRQQLQTVHYVCMPMHTQGYSTQNISRYVRLPRRQAMLMVY